MHTSFCLHYLRVSEKTASVGSGAQGAIKAKARRGKRRPLTRIRQESLPAVSESEGEDEENAEQCTRDVEVGRRERVAAHNGSTEPSCTGRGMR
jgi:hypothetical protein